MNENIINQRLDAMQKEIDNLKQSSTIPLSVDRSFQARGFLKTSNQPIFLDAIDFNPTLSRTIAINFNTTTYGGSTTQFDITNPSTNIFRYTYDGTGTNPNISSLTMPEELILSISGTNFNVANNGTFSVYSSGTNYFEVVNLSGVVENNKTIGGGSIQSTGQVITVPQYPTGYLAITSLGNANGFWIPLILPPRSF